jgi:shikimate kinase
VGRSRCPVSPWPDRRARSTHAVGFPRQRGRTRAGNLGGVALVYITGISGAGKSAVCHELKSRGYEAHEMDQEDNAVWVNRKTGEVTPMAGAPAVKPDMWLAEYEWRVVRRKVEALAQRAHRRSVFLCGTAANENEVWDLFSRVIYLAIDEQTLRHRLASRRSNVFGKRANELEAILSWHKVGEADYQRFGAVIIDATLPLHEVVDNVLEASA